MKTRSRRKLVKSSEKLNELSSGMLLKERRGGTPLLLVDCNPICYASFHVAGHLTYQSRPTGVIYGFVKKIFDLLVEFKTDRIFFFWDARYQYRKDYFPSYKEKRNETKRELEDTGDLDYESLFNQMGEIARTTLPLLGFNNSFVFHGYEADDIIAYILKCKKYRQKGRKIIVSNDGDLYQLLDFADMYLPARDEVFTSRDFEEKFGIPVKLWVKAKSIGGCRSDEVPGIQGVGDPRSPSSNALKYLRQELPQGKIVERIESRTGRQIILRNKILTKLPFRPNDIPPIVFKPDTVTVKKIIKTFTSYGFQSLCLRDYLEPIKKIFKKEEEWEKD